MEEFSLQVARPGVQPSSHGGGEASTAQEPKPDPETTPAGQEDDSEAIPPESFVPKTDPETDPVIAEASPQASLVSTPMLELSTPSFPYEFNVNFTSIPSKKEKNLKVQKLLSR
ncbi:hypothetical protein GmHk_04G010491 [Glycine max]|nr:hypothetical protein GmHk_04G010491 [Glycine max]